MDNNKWILPAAVIVAIVVVASVFSRFWERSSTSDIDKTTAQRLLQAASKWSVTAEQTTNPLLALIHTVNAKTYVFVLRELMSEHDVAQHFSVDTKKMLESLESRETQLIRKISAISPKLIPEGEHAGRTGWI
jgi:ERCC4-type nuclease